jgi:ParB-like chromosome segregation protein Spo0J
MSMFEPEKGDVFLADDVASPPPAEGDAFTTSYLNAAQDIPIERLVMSGRREERDQAALAGLVESIRTVGLIHPILTTEEGEKFRVVCGRRRVCAAVALGWETIPAVIWKLDDVHREMAIISENLHRLELTGAERDTSYLRYVQLYTSLYPNAEQEADERRRANLLHDEQKRREIFARPVIDTPAEAAARAFGVKPPTVGKALRRARAFTAAQRKVLELAKVPDHRADILAGEDADTIEAICKMLAAGFDFDASMHHVFGEQGRDYAKTRPAPPTAHPEPGPDRDPHLPTLDPVLRSLPARRAILDTEAFDGDASLFLRIYGKLEEFKQAIDWPSIEARHGAGPHGLYFRRLRLALGAPHPRSWSTCGCQFNPNPDGQSNCPTCRGGGYQIGG